MGGGDVALEAEAPEDGGGFLVGDRAFGLEEGGVAEGAAEVGAIAVLVIDQECSEGTGGDFFGVLEAPGLLDGVDGGGGEGGAGVEGDFPDEKVFAGEGSVGAELGGGGFAAEFAGDDTGFSEALNGRVVGVGGGDVGVDSFTGGGGANLLGGLGGV